MHSTITQLKELKLNGLLEAWQEQQAMPTYHDLCFDERFALLVEREHIRRHNQRLERRLRQAKIPLQVTLDTVDFNVPRGLRKIQFLEFAQGHWLHENLSLILVGPTGVGKSFLACVLANHLCSQGNSVRFIKTADLILELKLAKADGSYPKLRKSFETVDLLVLDEWLRDPLSTYEAREMLDLLDVRFRKASCLFATQIPIEQWHPQIQDPTLADAILDRIVHDAMKLPLCGESMRKLTSKLNPDTANASISNDVPKGNSKLSKTTSNDTQSSAQEEMKP